MRCCEQSGVQRILEAGVGVVIYIGNKTKDCLTPLFT